MAAATNDLDDIDETFFQCSICKKQLQEPKQLTCLHRFCSECLSERLQGSLRVIKCPECEEEVAVPEDGVSGFKTDFLLKNLIEFIRLKDSLENKERKQYCSCCKLIDPCSKREQDSAYCWECRGFLCQACHQFHRTDRDTKYHLPIFNLKDPKIHKLGIAKLSQSLDSPRCQKHREYITQLCCVTCNYDPICITCVHGDHGGHETEDINTTAQKNKGNLKDHLELLHGCKSSIYKLQDEAKSVCKNTDYHREKRKTSLKDCFKDQGDLLEQIRKSIILNCKNAKSETEKRYENRVSKLNMDMEKEIKQIRNKYAIMLRKTSVEKDDELQKIEEQSEYYLSTLEQEKKNVNTRFQDSEEASQMIWEKTEVRSVASLERSENIIKRNENLIATASSMLAAGNDWTAVQCIPDICSAITSLIQDMTNTLTALTQISQLPPLEVLLPVDVTAFGVSYRESIVNIQCKDYYEICSIDDMVNYVHGEGIIISGQTRNGGGYSQCINIHGKVLWREVSEYHFGFPQHDVQVFKMKAAVMCFPDAVTTLSRGNQNKSIWGVQLYQMIDRWPTELSLQCVAIDKLQKRIFAGFQNCRSIYVFNDILKLVAIFLLPPEAKYPFALSVSVGGLLIVCDASGKGVFSTNMKGEPQSTYLLPLLDSCDEWIPQSVCNDSKDDVFVLLSANEYGKVVVQYRKHGGHPIAFRRVRSDMSHVAVTQVDQEEKLLLVGCKCKELLVYSTTPYSDEHYKVEEESHKDSHATSVQNQEEQMQQPEEPLLISPEFMV